MTAQVEHLKQCCQKIITVYLGLYNPPRPGAALFCPECKTRVVNYGSSWETE